MRRHDPAALAAVETLLRTTGRPYRAIAEATGVPLATVATLNRRHGLRPSRYAAPRALNPAAWTEARRSATARLYHTPAVDLDDLAAALGASRNSASALFRACGLPGRRRPRGWAAGGTVGAAGADPAAQAAEAATARALAGDPARLGAALRDHIARQILRLDAALRSDASGLPDSGRVLRDLGGLRRLLADVQGEGPAPTGDPRAAGGSCAAGGPCGAGGGTESGEGGADGACGNDLAGLRARLARRYAAFAGERADDRLPGEPAAPTPAPARP